MRTRRPAALLVLLALVVLPALPGGSAGEDAFRYFPTHRDQAFHAVDVHPAGGSALVAGGSPEGASAEGGRYLLRYDGEAWAAVLEGEGSGGGPLRDVAWRPQGDYALLPAEGGSTASGEPRGSVLACSHPCRRPAHVHELWTSNVTRLAGSGFAARQVAWHPGGDHALVTGSALVRWNGTTFAAVEAGEDTLYNAVAWRPQGDLALVQEDRDRILVCRAPCRDGGDLEPAGITFGGPDGPRAVEDIAFHPSGETAYVVGTHDARAEVLVVDLADPADTETWRTAAYNPRLPPGEGPEEAGPFTGVAWDPEGSRALLTSTGRRQVTAFEAEPDDGTRFDPLLDVDGARVFDLSLEPRNGSYGLMAGGGGFYRHDPEGVPRVTLETPDPDRDHTFAEPFQVEGYADPKADGANITTLEWTITEPVRDLGRVGVGDWTEVDAANRSRRPGGTVDWSVAVDASSLQPGRYLVAVRAGDGEVLGPPSLTSFRVPGPEIAIESPGNGTRVEGRIPVNGTATPREPDGNVTGVEWRVTPTADPLDPDEGSWLPANLSREDGGEARWSLEWVTGRHGPCYHTTEVRAVQGEIRGLPSYRVAYVPGCLDDPPTLSVAAVDDANATVRLRWPGQTAARTYTVQVAGTASFADEATVGKLGPGATSLVHETDGPGTYHYRIKASNPFEESPWGTVSAEVEEPPTPDPGGSGGGDDPDGRPPDGNGTGEDPPAGGGSGGRSLQVPGPGAAGAALAGALSAAWRRRP